MFRTEINKAEHLSKYFSAKFTDKHHEYGFSNNTIVRYPLLSNGSRTKIIQMHGWGNGTIESFDDFDLVAALILPSFCSYDSNFEISFAMAQLPTDKPIKFDYVYRFHFDEFFIRLKKHLRLLNEAPDIKRKRELVDFETDTFKVNCFYRYDRVSQIVSKCARIHFKAFKGFPEHTIVALNDDHKFLVAMDDMEAQFQKRYYDDIVERKIIERGKFLSKKEQELIKMVYF